MSAHPQITTIKDYASQVLRLTGELNRALVELNKNLDRLPVAEIVNGDELARREKVLAERERELREKFAKVDALLGGDA